jgi:hypothetical protein
MEQPIAVRRIGSLKQLNRQMKQACHGTNEVVDGIPIIIHFKKGYTVVLGH